MKSSILPDLLIAVILVALGLVMAFPSWFTDTMDVESRETVDVVTDTVPVFIDTPIPKDSTVIRYKTVRVPVYDTISSFKDIEKVAYGDSVTIELPITQKVYEDSNYKAWVSGYQPSIDSILIYRPTTTITRTITDTEVRYKHNRWGVGVQAGVGATPGRIEPYVGIGVTYNILSW